MLLLLAIFGLVFASTALLVWQLYPAGAKVVGDYQAKRVGQGARQLDKMFVDVSQRKLFTLYALSPLVTGIGAFILGKSFPFALCGAAFGLAVPTLVIRILEGNRIRKFSQQLLDGLMILSSSLKGGLSLLQAFEVVVEEMPEPISQEFSLVLRENQMGVPLHESLEQLNKRMKSDALNLVITAIDISRETGGNLTEPFEKLMFTVRETDKLMSKVKTLTLQAKIQGILMSVMPFLFGIAIYNMNRDFLQIMIDDPRGRLALYVAGGLQIVGGYLLFKLSKVEV